MTTLVDVRKAQHQLELGRANVRKLEAGEPCEARRVNLRQARAWVRQQEERLAALESELAGQLE